MKKFFVYLAVFIVALSLCACKTVPDPKEQYDVSFIVGGEIYKTVTTDENGAITMPENPSVEDNYTFEGWYLDNGVWANEFTASTPITANTEV